ncbi:MAG TPA: phospholipase D family protein [Phycisphaerae bacterium]|nr:phospholipase D family protein [Phycisphaerae bacterium]
MTSGKRTLSVFVSCAVITVAAFFFSAAMAPPRGSRGAPSIRAYFSPGDELEDRIVREISEARRRIRIQMYIFTSKPIADALASAKGRGVDVTIVLDKSQENMSYGRWPVLRRSGVKILFDRDHDVANNKIILIDNTTVITGSYNLTKAASESNAENIVVIKHDEEVIERFHKNFEAHLEHSGKPTK